MQQVNTILARFPGPVTLTPSRLKMLAMFAGSLAFVAIAVFFLVVRPDDFDSDDVFWMWLALLFFGLCAAVFAALLLPGAASLTLAADGFELCNLYRRSRAPWQDVRAFQVQEFDDGEGGFTSKSRQVGYEVRTAGLGPERRGATWVGGLLPDNYRLPKKDLAWLMNEWRERALAPQPSGMPRIKAADSAG